MSALRDDYPTIEIIEGDPLDADAPNHTANQRKGTTNKSTDNTEESSWVLGEEQRFLASLPKKSRLTSTDLLSYQCCASACYLQITRLGVLTLRHRLCSSVEGKLTKTKIRKSVSLMLATICEISDDRVTIMGRIGNQRVCPSMLAAAVGIPMKEFLTMALESNSSNQSDHAARGTRRMSTKKVSQLGKAAYLIDTLSQPHPSGGLIMPGGLSTRAFRKLISPSCVLRMTEIRKFVKKKVRFRIKDTIVRCDVCVGLSEGCKETSKWSDAEKHEASKLREFHYNSVKIENLMISMCEQISREEKSILVIKTDGMGRHSTKLPHLVKRGKRVTDVCRTPYDVYGVQMALKTANDNEYTNYLYTTLGGCLKSDANAYASVLLDALSKIQSIPPTLLIVLDNVATNKSHVFLTFLSTLIAQFDKLEKVYVYFAHPGHTHNSCDAVFGNLVNRLMVEEAASPSRMDDLFRQVGSVEQIIRHAPIYDFSPLAKMAWVYHSRRKQRFFLLTSNSAGEAIFRYQKYVRAAVYFEDATESADGGSQFGVFKPGKQKDLAQFRPTVVPYDLDSMKASCTSLLSQVMGFIDPEARKEWETFASDASLQPTGKYDDQMAAIESALDQSAPLVVTCNEDTLQAFLQKHNLKKKDSYRKIRKAKQ